MRRGWQIAAPAPTGDPWGYYAECGRSCQAGIDRPNQETLAQPRTESSTEAMDTDEGQRTTARLIEEARCLSEVTVEPTYATIDNPITTMTEGSEAMIMNILATQDPRELTLSETGERVPTPLEMRASLPTGSFSPFDFDKEFQNRHGVRPEDVDKSWYNRQLSRGSSMITVSSDSETGTLRTEGPSPSSPTRGMEILSMPRVTRDREYAERGTYTENILALNTRLLQDIITGRWARQQLHGPIPNWYSDSFHNITQPWEGQPGGYDTPLENQRLIPTYGYQPRLLPIGPPSDVTLTVEPPSTVGPSASISETTIPRKE